MQTSSTRWHLLCIFALLWSGATAVQKRSEKAAAEKKVVKKLMRRERRHASNSSPPSSSTSSFEIVNAQQRLVRNKVGKLMRRERRASGTSPKTSIPLSPDGHPDALQQSDASSHSTTGHLDRPHMHAAAAVATAMSAPVGKAVANHAGKPVPPARFAEGPSLPASMISAEQNTKSYVENDIVEDIVNEVVNDIVGTPVDKAVPNRAAAAAPTAVSPSESHEPVNIAATHDGDGSKPRGDASLSTPSNSGGMLPWEMFPLHLWGDPNKLAKKVQQQNKKDEPAKKERQQDIDRTKAIVTLANIGIVVFALLAGILSWAYSKYRSRQDEIRTAWNQASDRG